MLNRRHFLQSIVAAALGPAMNPASRAGDRIPGELRSDPRGILDLPPGFQYRVVSRAGDLMSDGLRVPAAHDGMAAFDG